MPLYAGGIVVCVCVCDCKHIADVSMCICVLHVVMYVFCLGDASVTGAELIVADGCRQSTDLHFAPPHSGGGGAGG